MSDTMLLSDLPSDFRAFASDWMGDLDDSDGLPLHVPMAQSLLLAYIATRLGAPAEAVREGVRFYKDGVPWILEAGGNQTAIIYSDKPRRGALASMVREVTS